MNKTLHLKSIPAVIMLILLLVASFFGSEGTLLCFGKDGHLAVEFVDACNGSGFGSQLAEMESDACGPCMDVQFLSSPALLNHGLGGLTPHDQPLSFQTVAAVPSSNFIRETQTHSSIPFQKSLTSLNSIVLRI